jgi:serine/threonine protein kinase
LKLIKRGQTFRKDKQVLRNFEKELANLKRLSREHKHIIELFGSYTEPKFVGILFPVADYDLAAFMVSPYVTEKRWSIRPYFGCLASALAFLHDNNIRHKDIKPQNILIKNDEPYFTDFGLAVDWTDFGHSTTVGPTAMTPRYGAPEVAACEARNSSADIWSLGCVFLEMWAVLKGASIREVASLTSIDGRLLPYHSIDARLPALIDHIEKLQAPEVDSQPASWIKNMLQHDRRNRWSAHAVLETLRELGADQTTQYLYVGRCCLEDEDTAESVVSYVSTDQSDFRSRHTEKGRAISETRNEAPASHSPPMHESDVRRRHNVQILDLQSQLEHLSAQNRALEEAKARAEQSLYAVQKQRQTEELIKQKDDAEKPTGIDEAIVTFKGGDVDAQHGFEGRGAGHEGSAPATAPTALGSKPRRIANRTKRSIYTGAEFDSKPFRPYADHSSQASSNSYNDDELGDTDDGAESLGGRDIATTITDGREDTHKHLSMQAKRRYPPLWSPPEGPAPGIGPLSPPRHDLDIWEARTAGNDGVANTLVEGKESVHNLYAPPRPPKIPVRRSRQSLPEIPYRTGSSTEAYSSLSDTLRTSIPKTTARRGPAKTKKKASEKKGFIDSMMGRLRPDQDKPEEARSRRKVARSRNTVLEV